MAFLVRLASNLMHHLQNHHNEHTNLMQHNILAVAY
jgi:hypothetical protein